MFRDVDHLWLNQGFGRFAEIPGALGSRTDDTHAIAAGDVDGDGDLGLLFGNGSFGSGQGQQDRLCRNDGAAGVVDVTATHMPVDTSVTSAAVFADIDGDGDVDVVLASYLSASGAQNRILINVR